MTADDVVAGVPFVIEVLGPAGVGKTTLSRSLRRRLGNVAPDIDARLSKRDKFPFVIGNAVSLLPIHLRRYRHSRWFDRRETRSMAYLQAGLRLLARATPGTDAVTILDHGPVYRLAFLREFGPAVTTSDRYRRWWASLLERWAARLDMVVSLDAPDAVLLHRIRARGSWHSIRDRSDEEASAVLRCYRAAFEKTLAESLAVGPLTVLRFDTSQLSTEDIADAVLAAFIRSRCGGMPAASEVRERS